MPVFAMFLRGVNVGRGNRVPMADLRIILSDLGYSNVSTLLNSGNAVFTSKQRSTSGHALRIHGAIAAKLFVDVPVVVKSRDELDAIVSDNSLARPDIDFSRLLVILAQSATAISVLSQLEPLIRPPERFLRRSGAGYLYCANGILESKAGKVLLGRAVASVTTRNWSTVLKLKERAHAAAA